MMVPFEGDTTERTRIEPRRGKGKLVKSNLAVVTAESLSSITFWLFKAVQRSLGLDGLALTEEKAPMWVMRLGSRL